MITREEAAAWMAGDEMADLARWDLARTVVALYDELAAKDNLLRLAESSVSLLRGEVDHARLELRRLRAAEAPGTDDEAVAPWAPGHRVAATWVHPDGARVYYDGRKWRIYEEPGIYHLAIDAMRAAVPGSL